MCFCFQVGEKEIERLIKKLELDKKILAEASNDDEDEDDEAGPALQSQIVISKTTCSRLTIDMFNYSGRSYVVNLSACCAAIVVI